uniref:Uncharacterized protein n=1 Tax=viral metagenome TaxID=1070528 RepID=A0A6C0E2B9_9ZZZZ
MSIPKVPKSKKVREELSVLTQKSTGINAEISENDVSLLNVRRNAAKAYAEILAAKKRYSQAINDHKIFTNRKTSLIYRKEEVTRDIDSKEIELAVVIQEETEKSEKVTQKEQLKNAKKNKTEVEPILSRINKLPEDVVKIIGEYLTFNVRIELLESLQKTSTILNKMSPQMTHMFLCIICTSQEFVNLLPPEEAKRQIPTIHNEHGDLVQNPVFAPFYGRSRTNGYYVQEKIRIRYILNIAKEVNPQFVYHIMKTMRILCNPLKKYTIKYTTLIRDRAAKLTIPIPC